MSGLERVKEQLKQPLRICRRCGITAYTKDDLELFKIGTTGTYGREPICKKCWNKQVREYAKRNRQKIRKKHRDYMKTYYPEHRQERMDYAKEYHENFPEKLRAHNAVRNQPLDTSCSKCGATENLVKHHPDYSKPNFFVTLCRFCHFQLHRGS